MAAASVIGEKHKHRVSEGLPAPQIVNYTLTTQGGGPPGRVLTSHDSHNPVGETTHPEMHRSARKHRREGHRLRRKRSGSRVLLALLEAVQGLRQTQALWESGKSPGVMRNAEIQIGPLRVVHRCVAAWSPWFMPRCVFILHYIG